MADNYKDFIIKEMYKAPILVNKAKEIKRDRRLAEAELEDVYDKANLLYGIKETIQRRLSKEEAKAKSFDKIVKVFSDSDHYSDVYVLETIQEQIDIIDNIHEGREDDKA